MVGFKNIFHGSSTSGQKRNPYADPHHPYHSGNLAYPNAPTATTSTLPVANTAPRLPNMSVSTLALDPTSPVLAASPVSPVSSPASYDLMPRARDAVGRDAGTGRRIYPPSEAAESVQSAYQDRSAYQYQSTYQNQSAYQDHNDRQRQYPVGPSWASGNRYDIITEQMKRNFDLSQRQYQNQQHAQAQQGMETVRRQRSHEDEDAILPIHPLSFPPSESQERREDQKKEEEQEHLSAYQRSATLHKPTGTRYDLLVQSFQSLKPKPQPQLPNAISPSPSAPSTTTATTATEPETSAYLSRVMGTKRYDIFVAQMQARKAEQQRREDAFVEPVQGYYAPPPRVSMEYYTPEAAAVLKSRRVSAPAGLGADKAVVRGYPGLYRQRETGGYVDAKGRGCGNRSGDTGTGAQADSKDGRCGAEVRGSNVKGNADGAGAGAGVGEPYQKAIEEARLRILAAQHQHHLY